MFRFRSKLLYYVLGNLSQMHKLGLAIVFKFQFPRDRKNYRNVNVSLRKMRCCCFSKGGKVAGVSIVPLIHMSVFMPVPYCFDYYSFVI